MMKIDKRIIGAGVLVLATAGCTQQSRTFEQPRQPSARARDAGTAFISRENIAEAQRVLRSQGYEPGAVDGRMDDRTRQALRDFQRYNNVSVTGVLDQATVAELEKRGAHFTGSLGAMRDDNRPLAPGSVR